MNRRRAAELAVIGAAVFLIPNFQSLEGISFAPKFHVVDPLYLALVVIGSLLSMLSVYFSSVSD